MDKQQRAAAFAWVDRTTEVPMLLLSLLIVPVLLAPGVLDLSDSVETSLLALEWMIWAAFATELVVKTYLSLDRSAYLRSHWFDVIIVVLPFLRPLRITRSARALRAFRSLRILSFLFRISSGIREVLNQNGLRYVLGVGLVLLIGCSILVEHLESAAGGNIDTLPDAFWWSMTTITTVGYGDRFPITAEGRALAVILMISGITTFSILTANLAVLFNKPTQVEGEPTIADLVDEIRLLRLKVEELAARADPEDAPLPSEMTARN